MMVRIRKLRIERALEVDWQTYTPATIALSAPVAPEDHSARLLIDN